jgi:ubiquinone/menaquinone biosynthesis C-methylase UbiE
MISDAGKILEAFPVRQGSIVAELGAGAGNFAYALSKKVGESGKVFAVDIQKGLLEKLKKESTEKGIQNIEIIWGDIEVVGGTKLREASVDAVAIVNVLFQIDAKAGLVHEVGRILKNGGMLLLVDWQESFSGIGPSPEAVVDEKTARRIFETGMFQYKKNIEVGDHHYGLIFEKKAF